MGDGRGHARPLFRINRNSVSSVRSLYLFLVPGSNRNPTLSNRYSNRCDQSLACRKPTSHVVLIVSAWNRGRLGDSIGSFIVSVSDINHSRVQAIFSSSSCRCTTSLNVPKFTKSVELPKSSTKPRSVAFLVCLSSRRSWRRLLLPALFVPKKPVILPNSKSASCHALKFRTCIRLSICKAPCLGVRNAARILGKLGGKESAIRARRSSPCRALQRAWTTFKPRVSGRSVFALRLLPPPAIPTA